eukprot:c10036_g1_i1 orf=556-921(+)
MNLFPLSPPPMLPYALKMQEKVTRLKGGLCILFVSHSDPPIVEHTLQKLHSKRAPPKFCHSRNSATNRFSTPAAFASAIHLVFVRAPHFAYVYNVHPSTAKRNSNPSYLVMSFLPQFSHKL